jgi:hydroxymethylglutaryl-CoA reductase
MTIDSTLPNFRTLSPTERLAHISQVVGLDDAQYAQFAKPGALPLDTANGMIENVIGTFELPMAVAGYFQINGKDVIVPMAVEEPSIVAAASFMAKLSRDAGGFRTSSTGPLMRAQVQVLGVSDPYGARLSILKHKEELIELANSRDKVLIGLGGAARTLKCTCSRTRHAERWSWPT